MSQSYSSYGSQSAGDRSFSQERSGNAFGAYREQQDLARRQREYAQQPRPVPPSPSYGAGTPFGSGARQSDYASRSRQGWFENRRYAPPPSSYLNASPRSFGVWDGLLLWTLFNNLGRSGSSDWFYNHRDDPGVQQWRQEADRLGTENAEIRGKLDELDRSLARRDGQPRNPDYLPPDIPPEIAAAPRPDRTPDIAANDNGGSHTSLVWPVLLIGAGGLGYLAWRRRGRATTSTSTSTSTGGTSMSSLQQAGTLLRHKLSGEGYTPDRFRIGMTLQLDPTPFILAQGALKLPQPGAGSGGGQVSVSAVGEVTSGGTRLTRLYLPDGRTLVQLHLDDAGLPDECRLLGVIDEVAPADPAEWGVWLDPAEGLIGWPEFQTKDGKTYARAWAPGDARVAPRDMTETIEGLDGSRTVQSQAMLYAAPTGLPGPAPATEYVMVSAVQDGSRAWVEIRAGIDINPATLQLA